MSLLDKLPNEIYEQIMMSDVETFMSMYSYDPSFIKNDILNIYNLCKIKNKLVYYYLAIPSTVNYSIAIYMLLQDYNVEKVGDKIKYLPLVMSESGKEIVLRIISDDYYKSKHNNIIEICKMVLLLFTNNLIYEDTYFFDDNTSSLLYINDDIEFVKFLDIQLNGMNSTRNSTNQHPYYIFSKNVLEYCVIYGASKILQYVLYKYSDKYVKDISSIGYDTKFKIINIDTSITILNVILDFLNNINMDEPLGDNAMLNNMITLVLKIESDDICYNVLTKIKRYVDNNKLSSDFIDEFIDEDKIERLVVILNNNMTKCLEFVLTNMDDDILNDLVGLNFHIDNNKIKYRDYYLNTTQDILNKNKIYNIIRAYSNIEESDDE